MATPTDSSRSSRDEWAAGLLVPLGVMTVLAAAVALLIAGIHVADTFSPGAAGSELARDRGVGAATQMWATPLALAGIAAVFSGIALSLSRIRHSIRGRRDALVLALPRILSTNR